MKQRPQKPRTHKPPLLTPRMDRAQILCGTPKGHELPVIPGYRVSWDKFVRGQTTTRTYNRVRAYSNPASGAKVFVQYEPNAPWLAPVKATFCPNDRCGLQRSDVDNFVENFLTYQPLTFEVSFDFNPESGIDKEFILRHAIFGKSRPRHSAPSSERLTYGTRKSTKFVRAYEKANVGGYRVELQLNSEWLRFRDIQALEDLVRLPALIFPKHFKFARLDWDSIEAALLHRSGPQRTALRKAKHHGGSIHAAMRVLRNEGGLANPHRFLRTMRVTGKVRRYFRRWINRWCESDREAQ
jgi:hypothetical protein